MSEALCGWRKHNLERWWLRLHRLIRFYRLRADYVAIANLSRKIPTPWADGTARLIALSEKEVEAVGSEFCQREFSR